MPAQDRIYLYVVHALSNAGWAIRTKSPVIRVGKRDLMPDVAANHSDGRHIIIEIKDFYPAQSLVSQLSDTIGQYLIYETALASSRAPSPLYLATSTEAFHGIWSEKLGIMLRKRFAIKIIVIDLIHEEIVEWLE